MKRKLVGLLLITLVVTFSASTFAKQEINKEKAIELALKQNTKLQELKKEIAKTEAQLEEAEGAFYPSLDLGGSYTRSGEAPQPGASKDRYSMKLGLTQPLYLAGQLRSNYQIMKNRLKITKLNLEQQKEETIYQVLEEYYNILKAKKMLKVRQQQVEQTKKYVEVAKANKKVGIHTKSDFLQARVSYNQAQQELLVAKNNLETAKLSLKNTLNLADNTELEITDNLKWQPKEFKLTKVYDYALNHKIAFKLLDLQEEIAELNLESKQKSSYLPTVNLNANYTASDDQLTVSDGDWQTTLSFSYNIFNGGRDKDQIKQKSKELEKVQITKEQTKNDVKLLIKKTLLDLRAAKDRITLSELNLKQSKENLANNEVKFKEGLITSLDLLDVQTTYQQVKTQYYQAIYDYNLAVAELNKAIGKIKTEY